MSFETDLFINGKYVPSSTNTTFTIHNPADDTLVSDKIQVASQQDVDAAVDAAKAALPAWKNMPSTQRAAIIVKFADLLEANADRLAKLETVCMGAPISLARMLLLKLVPVWRYYAGLAGNVPGESFPPDGDGRYKIISYEPLGVCAGITAWNATHALVTLKAAPALAAGNTFILKSSEKSPLGLAQYGHLINEAGFPPGVFNIIAGDGSVGDILSSHMSIAKISFTGSTNAGRAVQIAAAKSNLKRVTLELGGKSPAIVFDDADLNKAVYCLTDGFLFNSGQICYATSRAFVQEGIAPAFIKALKASYEKASEKMGDPSLSDTVLGPLVDKKQLDHVMRFLDASKSDGIEPLTGGERKGSKSTYVQPTVFLNPDLDSKVYNDEIFGPVLCIRTFKTESEAITLANNTPYGLAGSVYTQDVNRAFRVASLLEAGTISINTPCLPGPQAPFGGFKQSGYGRELGIEGIKNYMQTKTIMVPLQ